MDQKNIKPRATKSIRGEIAADAKEWARHKRDPSYLYTGTRLANMREQLTAKKLALRGLTQEFMQASLMRQQRVQTALITGSILTALLLIMVVAVSYDQIQKNVDIANTAQANAVHSQKRANIALAHQLAAHAQLFLKTGDSGDTVIPILLATQVLSNMSANLISSITSYDAVTSVAFSPDSKYVVSGNDSGTARVWEAVTGKEIARMTHGLWVSSVAFSPNGRYIVSGSLDGTARVWEVATGKELARMTHGYGVDFVRFSPDGKYAVPGSKSF